MNPSIASPRGARRLAWLAAAGLALAASPALAQFDPQPATGKWGSFELGAGPYRPNVDSEFSSGIHPYRDVFGSGSGMMFRLHLAKAVYDGPAGTLEVGFKTGFFSKSGHAIVTGSDPVTRSADHARFSIIPTSLTFTYRADMIYERYRFPLVPYARLTLERYNWWTTKESKITKRGATNGGSASVGVVLILDPLDPQSVREANAEAGLEHFGLYGDVTKSKVDDFGSKKSWDLSDDLGLFWSGGLLFVF